MGSDKNGKKTGPDQSPVFERITSPEDASRYDYSKTPTGQPSVSPTENPVTPEPVQLQPELEQVNVTPEPEPVAEPVPEPAKQIPELDRQVVEEAKVELREVARKVASEKYNIVDTLDKALMNPKIKGVRWGVIGTGQGGSRLAEQFYRFGYPACAINTAKQDLTFIQIPEENKLFMDYALGGAGKDMAVGEAAIGSYRDDVLALMRHTFGEDVETIVCCVGGGGGTGSGSAVSLVKLIASFGLPVIVLYTLPMANEGSVTKANAIRALDKVARLSQENTINALVVVDNSKIEQIYPSISAGQFWKVANFDIVNVLNMFNTLCRCDTDYDSLDPMDFARIFSTGNCTIYGKIEVPVEVQGGQVVMFESELANAVKQNMQGGLLAEGFDLKQTIAGGVIVTAREDILNQIPAINVNFMYHELNRLIGDANIYRGLYKDNNPRNVLTVYTIFSGLGLPQKRVESLLVEAQNAMETMDHKAADKSKMTVMQDAPAVGNEQKIYDDMRQRDTAFGRLASKRGKRRGVGRG